MGAAALFEEPRPLEAHLGVLCLEKAIIRELILAIAIRRQESQNEVRGDDMGAPTLLASARADFAQSAGGGGDQAAAHLIEAMTDIEGIADSIGAPGLLKGAGGLDPDSFFGSAKGAAFEEYCAIAHAQIEPCRPLSIYYLV